MNRRRLFSTTAKAELATAVGGTELLREAQAQAAGLITRAAAQPAQRPYADQAEKDHAALRAAARAGIVEVQLEH